MSETNNVINDAAANAVRTETSIHKIIALALMIISIVLAIFNVISALFGAFRVFDTDFSIVFLIRYFGLLGLEVAVTDAKIKAALTGGAVVLFGLVGLVVFVLKAINAVKGTIADFKDGGSNIGDSMVLVLRQNTNAAYFVLLGLISSGTLSDLGIAVLVVNAVCGVCIMVAQRGDVKNGFGNIKNNVYEIVRDLLILALNALVIALFVKQVWSNVGDVIYGYETIKESHSLRTGLCTILTMFSILFYESTIANLFLLDHGDHGDDSKLDKGYISTSLVFFGLNLLLCIWSDGTSFAYVAAQLMSVVLVLVVWYFNKYEFGIIDEQIAPMSSATNVMAQNPKVIPPKATSIPPKAYARRYDITAIDVPDSVTEIGEEAFYICKNAKSLNIGQNVQIIGAQAFASCSGISSIIIPDSVVEIGKHAFAYCSSLSNLIIGTGVTKIDTYAFLDCNKLSSIKYKGTMAQWNSIRLRKNWIAQIAMDANGVPSKIQGVRITVECTDGTIRA